MPTACIPVDLFNPGQVFASLGFLEAASILCSRASGGFDWADEAEVKFVIEAFGDKNPFEVVLQFLVTADVRRIAPPGYADPPQKKQLKKPTEGADEERAREDDLLYADNFPMPKPDQTALPIRLTGGTKSLDVSHWADGSSRNAFKLYAGNRDAAGIARAMLIGARKSNKIGELKTKGIRRLWEEQQSCLVKAPFDVLTPMGGSFNFDPRGAWTGLEAGYSLNDQKHGIAASPVVELLAALGLQHARPVVNEKLNGEVMVQYAAWGAKVPASLARAALCGSHFGVPLRIFKFRLDSSGKNKIVTFAEEDI